MTCSSHLPSKKRMTTCRPNIGATGTDLLVRAAFLLERLPDGLLHLHAAQNPIRVMGRRSWIGFRWRRSEHARARRGPASEGPGPDGLRHRAGAHVECADHHQTSFWPRDPDPGDLRPKPLA